MEIVSDYNYMCAFETLVPGDVFQKGPNVFLKVDGHHGNAVRIQTEGRAGPYLVVGLDPETLVRPLRATLTLEDGL